MIMSFRFFAISTFSWGKPFITFLGMLFQDGVVLLIRTALLTGRERMAERDK